ncbi:hypothetical protein NCLIV_028420 [Neospora caninum Liverpool]|uniref:Phosphodiesterase n=1 Tax=Neospora caninum (strain Liverpool) TaxID=572307 RepID=F0VH59_NEOCL|nr:hypothetical protein NCLIV_028420 [Neospora caninum Liverpool]CBZ53053.1 hypothetical protein NCLIV_028420 [Neospora caninum Liverpool]|eukprot:XP_003883085.1 hypothetical protein NCLIV_028420 [Neospora caninum Liverpool]
MLVSINYKGISGGLDICLWPVCLVAVASFQAATLLTGGADGLRPSIINGLLLMLLAYLALVGRRALELQLRLQCRCMIQAQASVGALRARLAAAASLPPPPTPPTGLESVMNALEASLDRMSNVKTALASVTSQSVPRLLSSTVQHYSGVSAHVAKKKSTNTPARTVNDIEGRPWGIGQTPATGREQGEESDKEAGASRTSRFLPFFLSWQRKFGNDPEGVQDHGEHTQSKRSSDGAAEGAKRTATHSSGEEEIREDDSSLVPSLWGAWVCTEVDQVMHDVEEVKRQLGDLGGLLKVDINAILRASLPEDSRPPSCASSPPISPAHSCPSLAAVAVRQGFAAPPECLRADASRCLNPLSLSAYEDPLSGSPAVAATAQSAGCHAGCLAWASNAPLQSVSVLPRARRKRVRGGNATCSAFRLFLGSELTGHRQPSFQAAASSFKAPFDGRQAGSVTPHGTDVHVLVDAYATLRKTKTGQTSKAERRRRESECRTQTMRREELRAPISILPSLLQTEREGGANPFFVGKEGEASGGKMHEVERKETQAESVGKETRRLGEQATDKEGGSREDTGVEGPTRRGKEARGQDVHKNPSAADGELNNEGGTPDAETQGSTGLARDSRSETDEKGRQLERRISSGPPQLVPSKEPLSSGVLLGRGVASASDAASPVHGLSAVTGSESVPSEEAHRAWTSTRDRTKEQRDGEGQLHGAPPVYFYIGDEEDDGTGSSYRSSLPWPGESKHQDILVLPGKQLPAAARLSRAVSFAWGTARSDIAEAGKDGEEVRDERCATGELPATRGSGAEAITPTSAPCRPMRSAAPPLVSQSRCGPRGNEATAGQRRRRGAEAGGHRQQSVGKLRQSSVDRVHSLGAQISAAFASYLPLQQLANRCNRVRSATKQEHPYRFKLPNTRSSNAPASGVCLVPHLSSGDGGTESGATDTVDAAGAQTGDEETRSEETGDEETGDQKTGGEETGSEETGNEDTAGERRGREKAGMARLKAENSPTEVGNRRKATRRATDAATLERDANSAKLLPRLEERYAALPTSTERIERLRERIGACWALDLLQLHEWTEGRALQTVGATLLCRSPSISSFFHLSVPSRSAKPDFRRSSPSTAVPSAPSPPASPSVCSFLETLALSYHATIPYHNSVHAADVAHMLRCLLRIPAPRKGWRPSPSSSPAASSSAPARPLGVFGPGSCLREDGSGDRGGGRSGTEDRQKQPLARHARLDRNCEEGTGTLWGLLSPTQRAASMVAALAHDVGHPGTTNAFEVCVLLSSVRFTSRLLQLFLCRGPESATPR